jgi:nicotinamide riboside transporter PnuC
MVLLNPCRGRIACSAASAGVAFSSYASFSLGLHGSTLLEIAYPVERYKIGGFFTWKKEGRRASEAGVTLPDTTLFENQ